MNCTSLAYRLSVSGVRARQRHGQTLESLDSRTAVRATMRTEVWLQIAAGMETRFHPRLTDTKSEMFRHSLVEG